LLLLFPIALILGFWLTFSALFQPTSIDHTNARGLARPADVLAVLDGAVARTPHAVALAVVTIIAAVIAGLGLL
jgi:uncharacterized membrane protein YedE/YeeE